MRASLQPLRKVPRGKLRSEWLVPLDLTRSISFSALYDSRFHMDFPEQEQSDLVAFFRSL